MSLSGNDRRGRNLLIVCFVITVYLYAGGEVTKQGILFGGSVEFRRPWMLEWAGVFIYFFALYQFVRTNWGVILSQFGHIVQSSANQNPLLKAHLATRVQKEIYRRATTPQDNVPGTPAILDWLHSGSHDVDKDADVETHFPPNDPPHKRLGITPPNYMCRRGASIYAATSVYSRASDDSRVHHGGILARVNPFFVGVLLIWSIFACALTRDEFWDRLFPMIIAMIVAELLLLYWIDPLLLPGIPLG